jgi:predicted MFS family arabinose efflux permease
VISIPTSGIIAGTYGWEAVFYIHGGLAIIWCFLWAVFVTDDTQLHPFMSEEERKFIDENHAKGKKDPAKVN